MSATGTLAPTLACPGPDSSLAPIAVFVYKRPEHTRRMLESLKANEDWERSPIFVFCDGPKRPQDRPAILRTRETVREVLGEHAQLVERETNIGLARSVIAGVTEVINRYGSIIVLEDDLVLSPAALRFMNAALNRYRDVPQVMHISAYMFPVSRPLPEVFFYREATCWGWATWDRAWARFVSDEHAIRDFVLSSRRKGDFNVRDTMDFFGMLEDQIAGKVDSWAIRWYGTMFMHGGLALHPGCSLVQNTGFDGTGANCGKTAFFDVSVSDAAPTNFPEDVRESDDALAAMIDFRSVAFSPRLKFLRKIFRRVRDWV